MPQDAEVRQILLDLLKEMKDQVKEHDKRIRTIEVRMARWIGAIGVLSFIYGGALAFFRR